MQILKIDSAVTGDQSVSRQLTQAVVEHFQAKNSDAQVVSRDLAANPLDHMDGVSTGAIRFADDQLSDEMKAVRSKERAIFEEFTASDIVVIGAPMYNFSIPSQLKAWLDRLGIPGLSFTYGANGPEGLAGGRKVIVVSSQGGVYERGGPAEHQESLMATFLGFIGVSDVTFITANGLGSGPDAVAGAIAKAKEEIAKL